MENDRHPWWDQGMIDKAQGSAADRVLFRLWAENTGIPRMEAYLSRAWERLGEAQEDVRAEREEMRSTTVYCGYGATVDSIRDEIEEVEDDIDFVRHLLKCST